MSKEQYIMQKIQVLTIMIRKNMKLELKYPFTKRIGNNS